MIRSVTQLWLVLGSLAAGGIALSLLWYLYGRRERPGAGWFMGNIAAVAVFCVAYGVGLLIFDPVVRESLEQVAFASICFMGPLFLAFGLDYTGRTELLRGPLSGVLAGVPLVTVGLLATNPLHGLVWQEFALSPTFGAATVDYTIQPWGVFAILFSIVTGGIGSLALVEAILDYGQLYRREATAVVLSTVPPTVGVSLWLFEVGPVPQLNLTSVFMLVHLALDSYAFVGTHMFETNPATQRAAERSALDDLNEPLLVLDTAEEIVNLNTSAERLFGLDERTQFPVPLADVVGMDRNALVTAGEAELDGKLFAVSQTPLSDRSAGPVGEMLVFYDITTERQREQQLSVLNRVLRHNLSNEMTVIRGRAEAIREDDGDDGTQAASIIEASDRLLSLVGNIRDSERVLQGPVEPVEVDISATVEAVRADVSERYPSASIDVRNELSNGHVSTDPAILSLALENIVENAVVHADTDQPDVTIRLTDTDGTCRVAVTDTNEEIPDIELSSLRTGQEEPLRHGRGLGLWTADRCLSALDGEIRFEYDGGNTVVIQFPVD